jgi:hypothetical protein
LNERRRGVEVVVNKLDCGLKGRLISSSDLVVQIHFKGGVFNHLTLIIQN